MFLPKGKHEQTGPIAYTVTKGERSSVLEEIDRQFGDELAAEDRGERRDDHSAIVLAVKFIRDNLQPETYEELRQREQ